MTAFGGGSIMIRGSFWKGGLSPLHVFEDKVDSKAYTDCLEETFIPWCKTESERENIAFFLQEDGATCHTSRYTKAFKEQKNIRTIEYWPSNSPDLNPIENIWAILDQAIKPRRRPDDKKQRVIQLLKEEWEKFSIQLSHNLVESMPHRCQKVIDANGEAIDY